VEHGSQLLTRFTELAIPRFEAGMALGQFLLTLERSIPIRLASNLSAERMQRAILDETQAMQTLRGLIDGVVKVVQEAAVAAVCSGLERVGLEEAPKGYKMFKEQQNEVTKVVLKPGGVTHH
jgi:hypothetical protein